MTLRIERIVTRLVQLPLAEPIKHPFMGERTQFATLLVQVHCSDGCVGLGYASLENLRMTQGVRSIVQALEPALAGKDPLRRAFLHDLMWNLTVDLLHDGASNIALAALDVALWDICGKQAGLPVWRLLGGFRDKVPAYASGQLWRHHSNERLAEDAERMVAEGWRAMKLRLGLRPLAEDIARATLVRRAVGPDVHIMVDALWGLTPMEGIYMARALADLGYAWLEEPVREGDFAGLAQVRSINALPIAGGERVSRLQTVPQLVQSVDHAILDVSHLGGVTPWMKAAAVMDIHDIPVSTHSYCVISHHLLAGIRKMGWLEYMDWWNPLFLDPPVAQQGFVQMNEKPGLGLEPNEDMLRRHAAD